MKAQRVPNSAFVRLIVLLVALVSGTGLQSVRGENEEAPVGIIVYKTQPWHKADKALVREYLSVRRFPTVVYVTEPGQEERRMQRSLVFEAHDYLPFDATGTAEESLPSRIDKEIAALEDLSKRFPATRPYVEPRVTKWHDIREKVLAEAAVSPTPAPAQESELSTGSFGNTELPPGGALGTVRLKNGEEFQAWITALTPTQLKWDEPVKEGSGVYQERTVPLNEVQSLQVYTAEDVASSEFKKLEVPQTSLTVTASEILYQHYFRLLQKLKAQFGSDPRYAEWHAQIVQIREDMEQAQSTQSLRIDGRWLSREETQQNAYENTAKVLWASAQQMAALSQWRLAISYCRELQKDYSGSRAFVEHIPVMTPWLENFAEKRKTLPAQSRGQNMADEAAATLAYIQKFDLEAAQKSLKLSASAEEAIERGDREEAESFIRDSAQAWSKNAELKILRQRLSQMPQKE